MPYAATRARPGSISMGRSDKTVRVEGGPPARTNSGPSARELIVAIGHAEPAPDVDVLEREALAADVAREIGHDRGALGVRLLRHEHRPHVTADIPTSRSGSLPRTSSSARPRSTRATPNLASSWPVAMCAWVSTSTPGLMRRPIATRALPSARARAMRSSSSTLSA